jgi:hypothetical protein
MKDNFILFIDYIFLPSAIPGYFFAIRSVSAEYQ